MCSNPKSPFLAYANEAEKTWFWFRADCGLWSCWECAQKNKTRLAGRAGQGAQELIDNGLPIDHITITANRYWRGQERSIANFRKNWPKLRKRIQYHIGDFRYAIFAERHPSDNATMHIHMLCTNIFTTRWWKDNAHSCGLGFQSKVVPVGHGGFAAYYATKYLNKSIDAEGWPKSFHRARFSQNWPEYKADFKSTADWRVFMSSAHLHDEMRHWLSSGYRIVNTRTGELANAQGLYFDFQDERE